MRSFVHKFPHVSRATITTVSVALGLGVVSSCQDLTAKLPAGYIDPAFYTSAEAASQMARNARFEFQQSLIHFMLDAGMIADEFFEPQAQTKAIGFYDGVIVLDSRYLPDLTQQAVTDISDLIDDIGIWSGVKGSYVALQRVRSRSVLARGAIRKYVPDSSFALQAELAAYEGFAEIMLADLYCSGVPLSVIEFEGDFQYRPGSRTLDVYRHAIALLDTAEILAGPDAQLRTLARLGKGRALLALGRYQEAAEVVVDVPQGFRYDVRLLGSTISQSVPNGINWSLSGYPYITRRANIADKKGENGVDFLSAQDPRIQIISVRSQILPAVQTDLIVANHLEARLIEAEAKIHAGDTEFLTILNTLRTDGSTTVDTDGQIVYGAGTGGVPGLAPLTDPGIEPLPVGKTVLDVRIDLLMRERAFWLFFRGIRQGDLRRLVREYQRPLESVYPIGPYPAAAGLYGAYMDIPIPRDELPNPFFTGCLTRGE